MGWLILIGVGLFIWAAVGIHGWFSDKSTKIKSDIYNRELRAKLQKEQRVLEELRRNKNEEIKRAFETLHGMENAFREGILNGRKWLAKMIAEADKPAHDTWASYLRNKKYPAKTAAQQVSAAMADKRLFKEKVKFLEYQLLTYEEYFPELEEYRDAILDEAISFTGTIEDLTDADPVLKFIGKEEYEKLSNARRNQLALDRYLKRNHRQHVIGRFYERYLGYLREQKGWKVDYYGIHKGYEDLGRDLICSKNGEVRIIQAKCWSTHKTIHEKHIFQLFGTTQLYLMNHNLPPDTVRANFITSTSLSDAAKNFAGWLNVEINEQFPLSKTYPMIKCNINQRTKEKIYHLPFDQQYDRTRIIPESGECYVKTTEEAERLGFRRAFRHIYT